MALFDFLFKKPGVSASVAKERLQIVVSQQRVDRAAPDFLPVLQKEVLAVVGKYLEITDDMLKIQLEKIGGTSVLEINIALDKARIKARPGTDKPAILVPKTAR
jgi:cell division topological specificity factor